jgi:hypothetical protein
VNPKINESEMEQPKLGVGTVMRNAVKQAYLKWPNGRIPYSISTQYTSFGLVFEADLLLSTHSIGF